MKKFTFSVAALMAISTFTIAGGDIAPVPVIQDMEPAPISNFYVGLAYSYIEADIDGTEKGNAYMLLAGYNFNPYIAVEARYAQTVGDIDVEGLGDREREVTNKAIYLKPQYPLTESFGIYALLGYGEVVARATSGDGFQWGLGIDYMITENTSIFVDYTSLYDDKLKDINEIDGNDFDSQFTSVNVGVTYSF